jgi:hypothetical protein
MTSRPCKFLGYELVFTLPHAMATNRATTKFKFDIHYFAISKYESIRFYVNVNNKIVKLLKYKRTPMR